nr:DUF6233 domain-containing protein [Streptomyces sp. SID4926]
MASARGPGRSRSVDRGHQRPRPVPRRPEPLRPRHGRPGTRPASPRPEAVRWLVAEDYTGGGALVHRADCAQAPVDAEPADDAVALQAAAAGARPCPVCRPETALRALAPGES